MADSTRESDRILREAKTSLAVQREGGTHRPAPRGQSIGKGSAELKLKSLLTKVRNIALAIFAIWLGAGIAGAFVNGIGFWGVMAVIVATAVAVAVFSSFPKVKVPKRAELTLGNPAQMVAREVMVPSHDGTLVPASIIHHRDLKLDGNSPTILYGYGAYGESLDPWFSHARLSLLERGVAFAIAHVRGGGELGEAWYRAGKQEHKHNTFSDFIACAEFLILNGITTAEKLAISGGSAGGLLIGAVLNQRPDLFGVAIAEVPFVDVLNTMLDPDLPLTVTEYDEWGNPEEPDVYERIKAYAPYENVTAQDYPATLVIAGYNDSRVQYWEAAKWVAKLRATKTDDNVLLLKTELGAGHGGMSGRYQGLRDVALEYAFVFKALGLI